MGIGLFLLALAAFVLLLILLFAALPLLWPLFAHGAPYVGSHARRVDAMIAAAHLTPDDVAADLGSGDGRIVRAAARAGVREAVGYEIQPALVWWSRLRSHRCSGARFVLGSFWHADLRGTNVVFLYQLPHVMARLSAKLKAELPPGARIVSNGFRFPDWPPLEENDGLRVYRV